MRVLFCTTPGPGHVLPLVSTAWALQAAGHDVLFATSATSGSVTTAGLSTVDVAPDLDMGRIFYRHLPAVGEYVQRQQQQPVPDHGPLIPVFAEICDAMAEGTVRVARRWRPDLVIHTLEQGVGPLVAAKLGVPAVIHGFGLATPIRTVNAIAAAMSATYERHGVTAAPEIAAVIDPAPPSMRIGFDVDAPGLPDWWGMRFVPYCGGIELPDWLAVAPDRPRVAVTLGTTNPSFTGVTPLRRVIDAAADLDAEFVLALGDADPTPLGTLPDNVRACGWIPLNVLLRTSVAQIHHGGGGSVLVALRAGVPQLILPQGNDHFYNAAALADAGAGLTSADEDVDVALLRNLLSDDKLRRKNAEISEEMAALPSPAVIAERLASLR
jgi:UDP:flavonoid glycosyltransferase YjiC (YdhE family)